VQIVAQSVRLRDKVGVGRQFDQPGRLNGTEQRDGIIAGLSPGHRVDGREQPLRRVVPRPPEVRGKFFERGECIWDDCANGKSTDSLHLLKPMGIEQAPRSAVARPREPFAVA
jgi:hypothetical protein